MTLFLFIYLFSLLLPFELWSMDSLSFYYFVSKKQPYVENFTLIQIWQLQFSHAFKNFATVNWHDKFFHDYYKISILPFPFDCEWHHNWAELSAGGLHVLIVLPAKLWICLISVVDNESSIFFSKSWTWTLKLSHKYLCLTAYWVIVSN